MNLNPTTVAFASATLGPVASFDLVPGATAGGYDYARNR
jgi:hypothetical protein